MAGVISDSLMESEVLHVSSQVSSPSRVPLGSFPSILQELEDDVREAFALGLHLRTENCPASLLPLQPARSSLLMWDSFMPHTDICFKHKSKSGWQQTFQIYLQQYPLQSYTVWASSQGLVFVCEGL